MDIVFTEDGQKPLGIKQGRYTFELPNDATSGTIVIANDEGRERHTFTPSTESEDNEIMLYINDQGSTATITGATYPFTMRVRSAK